MSEILTPQEICKVCNEKGECLDHEDGNPLCAWAESGEGHRFLQAQLAKCKEHYEKELEFQRAILQDLKNSTEKFIIPARIAEAEKKGAQDMLDYLKQTKPAEVDEAIKLLIAEERAKLIKYLDAANDLKDLEKRLQEIKNG